MSKYVSDNSDLEEQDAKTPEAKEDLGNKISDEELLEKVQEYFYTDDELAGTFGIVSIFRNKIDFFINLNYILSILRKKILQNTMRIILIWKVKNIN